MPKINLGAVPEQRGTGYPRSYHDVVKGRVSRRLGDAGGLTQFGVNLVTLEPHAQSALRHWHEEEDEFVIVTKGQLMLYDDDGAHLMDEGDCAAFSAGDENGHHLVNETDQSAEFLVIGSRVENDVAYYSEIDMKAVKTETGYHFSRKDGSKIEES